MATAVFLTWAARRLRPIAATANGLADAADSAWQIRPLKSRPPIGDRPVLWKAVHFDFRRRRTVFGQAIAVIAFALSFLPVRLVLLAAVVYRNWRELPATINDMIVRGLGTDRSLQPAGDDRSHSPPPALTGNVGSRRSTTSC